MKERAVRLAIDYTDKIIHENKYIANLYDKRDDDVDEFVYYVNMAKICKQALKKQLPIKRKGVLEYCCCGEFIYANMNYCPNCGQRLQDTEESILARMLCKLNKHKVGMEVWEHE